MPPKNIRSSSRSTSTRLPLYANEEIELLLYLVRRYLPVDNKDWKAITFLFNKSETKHFDRKWTSLRSKFNNLQIETSAYQADAVQLYEDIVHKSKGDRRAAASGKDEVHEDSSDDSEIVIEKRKISKKSDNYFEELSDDEKISSGRGSHSVDSTAANRRQRSRVQHRDHETEEKESNADIPSQGFTRRKRDRRQRDIQSEEDTFIFKEDQIKTRSRSLSFHNIAEAKIDGDGAASVMDSTRREATKNSTSTGLRSSPEPENEAEPVSVAISLMTPPDSPASARIRKKMKEHHPPLVEREGDGRPQCPPSRDNQRHQQDKTIMIVNNSSNESNVSTRPALAASESLNSSFEPNTISAIVTATTSEAQPAVQTSSINQTLTSISVSPPLFSSTSAIVSNDNTVANATTVAPPITPTASVSLSPASQLLPPTEGVTEGGSGGITLAPRPDTATAQPETFPVWFRMWLAVREEEQRKEETRKKAEEEKEEARRKKNEKEKSFAESKTGNEKRRSDERKETCMIACEEKSWSDFSKCDEKRLRKIKNVAVKKIYDCSD